jgi:hypothetical protein
MFAGFTQAFPTELHTGSTLQVQVADPTAPVQVWRVPHATGAGAWQTPALQTLGPTTLLLEQVLPAHVVVGYTHVPVLQVPAQIPVPVQAVPQQ